MKSPADAPEKVPPPNVEQEDAELAAFTGRARDLLLDSVDALDGRTRSRLTQARHAALHELGRPRGFAFPQRRWLAPAGSLAALALVAAVWLGSGSPDLSVSEPVSVAAVQGSPLDDIEILATAENFELIEDMEFYEWLEAEAALTASPAGGAG